jgi:hypothetical protein
MKHKIRRKRIIVFVFLIFFFLVLVIGFYEFQKTEEPVNEVPILQVEDQTGQTPKPVKEKKESEEIVSETIETQIDILPVVVDENATGETEAEKEEEPEQKPEVAHTSTKELSPIYLPLTKSLFNKPDISENSFLNKPHLTQSQWEHFKIEETKIGNNMKNVPVENLMQGKLYYQGENGKLESFLYLDAKKRIYEYMISYDPKGNCVDCIEIGFFYPETGEKKYASISNHKLLIYELLLAKQSDKIEETVKEYSISPQMQFLKGKTFSKL